MNESSQISLFSTRRLWPMVLRLAIGAALLIFVFSHEADVLRVRDILRGGDVARLLMAVLIAITGELVTAVKWSQLVEFIGGRLPFATAVRASFIGMFYNNFFPGSVGGDVVRVLIIARYAGGKARATASAFMQRNTGLAGLFLIGIPASMVWPVSLEWTGKNTTPEWLRDTRTWLISAAVGYAIVNVLLFSRRAHGALWQILHRLVSHSSHHNLFRRAIAKFFQKLQRFHTEVHGYRFWLNGPLALSAFTQLIDIIMVWNLAIALDIQVSLRTLIVAVPCVTLANLLPLTINGIGLRETMYVALLATAGVAASQAVALSLMHFSIILCLSALGGFLQWYTAPRSFAQPPRS